MLSLVPQNQMACSELDNPGEHKITNGVILGLLSFLKIGDMTCNFAEVSYIQFQQ
jgi:hypothetical protein